MLLRPLRATLKLPVARPAVWTVLTDVGSTVKVALTGRQHAHGLTTKFSRNATTV